MFLVLSGVGGLLEEELVEGDATLVGKQSLVSTQEYRARFPSLISMLWYLKYIL